MTGRADNFQLVTCSACTFVYQNPQLSTAEMQPYYQEDYISYFQGTEATLSRLQWFLVTYGMRKRAQPLLRHLQQGRLLDVGCATGHFLQYMEVQKGWQVAGIEPNAAAARFAREHFQLDLHVGYLDDCPYPDHSFDVVTMWDVFEHLIDPHAALQTIKRLLKPGGLFVLRVPQIESVDARLFGRYWIGLDQPRHYFLFSKKTLHEMLERAGFAPVGAGTPAGSFFPFMLSVEFALFAHFGKNWWTTRLTKALRTIPLRLLSAPYFFIVDQLGWGPQMTVVARVEGALRPN
jgi:SAM-dependent methyltransferase